MVEPLLVLVDALTSQILNFDKEIDRLAETKYPETLSLRQVHGVGSLTALAFVLTLEDKNRFRKSRDVGIRTTNPGQARADFHLAGVS